MTIKEKLLKERQKNLSWLKKNITNTELNIMRVVVYPIVGIVETPFLILFGASMTLVREIQEYVKLDKQLSKWAKENSKKYN